jgi:hypothetical protein
MLEIFEENERAMTAGDCSCGCNCACPQCNYPVSYQTGNNIYVDTANDALVNVFNKYLQQP